MENLIKKITVVVLLALCLVSCMRSQEDIIKGATSLKISKDVYHTPLQIKLNRKWNNKYNLGFDTGHITIRRILLDTQVVFDSYTKVDFKNGDTVLYTTLPPNLTGNTTIKIEINDSASVFLGKITTNPLYMISYNLTQVKSFTFSGNLTGKDTVKITFDPQGWYMRYFTPFSAWTERMKNPNFSDYPGLDGHIQCSFWSYYQLGGPWRRMTAQETRKVQTTIE